MRSLIRNKDGVFLREMAQVLAEDPRSGARALSRRIAAEMDEFRNEARRLKERYAFERSLRKEGIEFIAGIDEAGRGCLAGPVAAAAVMLEPHAVIYGLDDSKKMTPRARVLAFQEICKKAVSIAVSLVPADYIDVHNIAVATFEAMKRSVSALSVVPQMLLVDGFYIPGMGVPQRAIKGGDRLSNSIAAASVVAKVFRDRYMEIMERIYPGYGFAENKGYATKEHVRAIIALGLCEIHRKTFCATVLNKTRNAAADTLLEEGE
ncbi:MAG TPA: ribonuclease HII [Clostridia bacterium]|nr:ribonuclease HII [Clostridia bacterium]